MGKESMSMWTLGGTATRIGGLAFVFFLFCTPALAQTGLLLGLRDDCAGEGCDTSLRTLWIAPKGGALTVAELPDLVVPRRDGFWRVGVRHYCDLSERNGGSEDDSISKQDVLFSVPVSKRATVEGLVACPKTNQRVCTASHISVTFLNPEYLSIEQGEEFNCGAHPDWSGSFTVSHPGDAERKAISFGSLKGLDAANEYRHATAHALIENLQVLETRKNMRKSIGLATRTG
jgi:hypothetical protein